MEFSEALKQCKIDNKYADDMSIGWSESLENMPAVIPFLNADQIIESRSYCRMDETLDKQLIETADLINNNEYLRTMIWHCYYQLFVADDYLKEWPPFTNILGDKWGCFYLLASLAIVPDVKKDYRALDIPENIIQDTCLEIKGFCDNHIAALGIPGIDVKQINWLNNYKKCRLFRLGRFEYKLEDFHIACRILKNKTTNSILVMAKDGDVYNSDGHCAYADMLDDSSNWTSTFTETDNYVEGHRISAIGIADKNTTRVSLDEWSLLSSDIKVVDMHIPPGGGLTPEACLDSMKQAKSFFKKYFSGQYEELIICASWIFDTQIEEQLPNSNLSKFMRELHLVPHASKGDEGFFFVFGKNYDSSNEYPRISSLQRFMLDTMESGERLRMTGMVISMDDLPHYGTQHYRYEN